MLNVTVSPLEHFLVVSPDVLHLCQDFCRPGPRKWRSTPHDVAIFSLSLFFFGRAKNLGICEATKDRSGASSRNRRRRSIWRSFMWTETQQTSLQPPRSMKCSEMTFELCGFIFTPVYEADCSSDQRRWSLLHERNVTERSESLRAITRLDFRRRRPRCPAPSYPLYPSAVWTKLRLHLHFLTKHWW